MDYLHWALTGALFFGLVRVCLVDVCAPSWWCWSCRELTQQFARGALRFPMIPFIIVAAIVVSIIDVALFVKRFVKDPVKETFDTLDLDEGIVINEWVMLNAEKIKEASKTT